MGLACFVCKLIISGQAAKLFSHLHIAHALYDGPGLVLRCDQGGCPYCFSSFNSFRKHIQTHHNIQIDTDEAMGSNVETDCQQNDVRRDIYFGEEGDPQECIVPDAVPSSTEANKRSAMFVLGLLSRTNTTRTSIQHMIQGTKELMADTIADLEMRTRMVLQGFGIDLMSAQVQELFKDFTAASNPFEKCSSRYLQDKYFVENLGLVKPKSIVLGTRYDTKTDTLGHSKQVIWTDSFQYIPLKETLGLILSDPYYLKEINDGHQSSDGILRDYCDGLQYKSHPLFSVSPSSLQLCLYFDEYEVVNPLGSKRGVHKVGAVYYTLQNLRPMYNSALCNIHLLAVFTCIDLQKYGFAQIFAPFLEELAELESLSGMEIKLRNGTTVSKRGTITQFLADNLGANSIAGLVESFVANFPCRTCLTSREEFDQCMDGNTCVLRNKLNYQEHLIKLAENPNSVSQHGLKRDCPLNKSQFFHITTNYAPDIMHDILEGVSKKECKLILSHLIYKEGYFSLDLLNSRIANFSYGFADQKNKPGIIAADTLKGADGNFKNSAAQMWCFLRFLPLLIGDKVHREHKHWELLLRLRRIMDIVFSHSVTNGMCRYLRCLIQDHHSLFMELFPDTRLTAKHHFMIHYPQMIQEIGPIVNCWCMRYEAKHAIGKTLAGIVCNFRDICYTIADRNQIRQCHQWQPKYTCDFYVKDMSVISVSQIQAKNILLEKFTGLSEQDDVYITNHANILGVEYRSGMMVAIGVAMEVPIFGQVKDIFVVGETLCLSGLKWVTKYFDEHYHAYVVEEPNIMSQFVLKQSELADHHTLHVCHSYDESESNLLYITTRSSIVG